VVRYQVGSAEIIATMCGIRQNALISTKSQLLIFRKGADAECHQWLQKRVELDLLKADCRKYPLPAQSGQSVMPWVGNGQHLIASNIGPLAHFSFGSECAVAQIRASSKVVTNSHLRPVNSL